MMRTTAGFFRNLHPFYGFLKLNNTWSFFLLSDVIRCELLARRVTLGNESISDPGKRGVMVGIPPKKYTETRV